MNQTPPDHVPFSAEMQAQFAREVAKFPPAHAQSAVMACLSIIQNERGWVSRAAEDELAAYLGMAPIAVYEVTTFYNMYNQQPVGKFKLNVCTNLPCQLRDGQAALAHICRKLDVAVGGTTADGRFTVQQSECLGACWACRASPTSRPTRSWPKRWATSRRWLRA